MRRFGIWFIVFGLLAFVLPHFGMDHMLFHWLGDARNPVAIGLLVVGAALVVLSYRKKPPTATV